MSKNPVMINGQRYASARAATNALQPMTYAIVMRRLNSVHWPDWVILKYRLAYVIDGVSYESIEAAASKLELSVYKVKQRLLEMGNGEVVIDLPMDTPAKKPSKLKSGSKPVSIDGVCFPTISSARFYNRRFGGGACDRKTMISRLHSDKPQWAGWTFISEEELPERLPYRLTDYGFPDTNDINCFLHQYAFVVWRYTDPLLGQRFKMIPGVSVDAEPKRGKQAMSFSLLDGTYLNVESDKLPPADSVEYTDIKNEIKRYLDHVQAEQLS